MCEIAINAARILIVIFATLGIGYVLSRALESRDAKRLKQLKGRATSPIKSHDGAPHA